MLPVQHDARSVSLNAPSKSYMMASKGNLLVVDDQPDRAKAMAELLSSAGFDVEVIVAVGFGQPLSDLFDEVEQVSVYRCGYCMSWRDNMPIYLARGPKVRFQDVWHRFRHYV